MQAPSTAEQAYQQTERWLMLLCHRHHQRFGGDFQELQSAVGELFIDAWHTWEPDRGALITWLAIVITRGLNRLRKREEKFQTLHPLRMQSAPAKREWNLELFLSEISEEARAVVSAVLEPPADILLDNQTQKRSAHTWNLMEHFRDLGWTAQQILNTFKEIREAL